MAKKRAENVEAEEKKELTLEQELEVILAKEDKSTFGKLCKLRTKIEQRLSKEPDLTDLFFAVNEEMKKERA